MRQRFTNKHLLRGGLGSGLLLLFITGIVLAQETRTLNVGSLHYTTNEGMTVDDMDYPAEWDYAESIYEEDDDKEQLDMLHSHGLIIGVARSWTDVLGTPHVLQVAQASHNKFTDIEIVVVPVADAFKRTYRNPYPTKVLDGVDRTSILAGGDPVDPNLPADVVIYSHNETWPDYGMGIDVERWSYAFANEDHDDYIIDEYLFTNTSGEARDSVYFCLTAELAAHTFYEDADIWGGYYGVTYWKYAAGDLTADSMRIWYGWDANDKADPEDTKGRPDAKYGTFQEPQYMSYVLIHADTSPTDETDDPRQPVKAGWSQRDLSPNLNEETHEGMYEFIAGPWARVSSNLQGYSVIVDENGDAATDGMYRVLDPAEDVRDWDMLSEQEKSGLFSCGPYNLKDGEDVRIVMAFAGGSITLRQAIDLGAAYDHGSPTQLPLVPLPYDIDDPTTGEPIVEAGETLDAGTTPNDVITAGKAAKDSVIDVISKKLAFANAAEAIETWKNATTPVREGVGDFGIPLAPAAPSLEGTSVYEKVELQWGNEAELDANTGTIAGYRIYRDFKWESSLPQDTTFVLLKDEDDLPAGTLEYVDADVARGQDYYYYITAVTTDGIESSMFLNMTGTSAERNDEALSPTRTPATATWQLSPEEGGVVVVPNPYHSSGDPDNKYAGRKLNFLNLPAYANVHIYTVTGDRVQTLEHDKGTGDKDWERQDTFSTMEIVSGVYIYVVEELDAAGGSPTGEKVIGKFVVVK